MVHVCVTHNIVTTESVFARYQRCTNKVFIFLSNIHVLDNYVCSQSDNTNLKVFFSNLLCI